MSTGIRDLRLWQEAVALGGDVSRAVHGCSRRETRQLTDRLLHTALDVAERVADGYERPPGEQARCYRRARATLTVLETLLAIARQAGLLPAQIHTQLTARTTTVDRLLGGYLTFVNRRAGIAAESTAAGDAAAGSMGTLNSGPNGTPPPSG